MPKQIFEKHQSFPFSNAIELNPYIFLSGMVAPKSDITRSNTEEIKHQTSGFINAVEKQLVTTGSTMENIHYLRIFLMDLRNTIEVNQMFLDYFSGNRLGCIFLRSSESPFPIALIEFEVFASLTEGILQKDTIQ